MTSGAGKGAFTCAKPIQIDVIVDSNVQKVVTFFGLQFKISYVFSVVMIFPLRFVFT